MPIVWKRVSLQWNLRSIAALLLCSSTVLAPVPAHATVLPSGFTEFPVASGLASPTAIAAAPDGRLFVCEQGGRLRLIKNGALLSTPFVTVPAVFHNELGLLGVALDPDFAANGYVYVYYSVNQRVDGTPDLNHRVSRFTASGDVAVAGSERVLLEILDTADDQYWHNGGALRFGADGKLLIAVGDRSQPDKAELRTNLQGKLLRMNADGSIPTDNPFYTTATGVHRLIWAYGLRNPYTFDTQPGTGRVFINDVGNRTWEEINDGIAGSFYGWDNSEGPTTSPGHRSPIYAYANDASTCAIVGAAFYNPPAVTFPAEYAGRYFFADHCARWIRMLDPANGNAVTTFATDTASALVDLEVGPDGSLFYLSQGTGAVRRISYTAGGTAPVITTQPADQTATVGQPVTFSVTASGAAPITYQWQRNNVDIAGATSASYRVNGVAMADNGAMFRCHVSNNLGSVFSRNATLTVTENRPPVATITAPADGTLYTAGQAITFTGTANDPEEGALPPSAFTWRVDFHHDTHTHPHLPPTSGATGGSFTPPTSGESSTNVWFRIHLSVVDSGGLAHEVFRDVMPRITRVTLATGPAGLAVNVDGAAAQPAPVVFDGVAGMTRTIGTTTPQTLDGQTWYFASWSDGGALEHPITVPSAAATFTATFSTSPAPPTPTPTPVPTNRRVEQDDPAVRNTGTWFTHTRTMHSAGSSALAMDTGSDATLTFQGTSVTWRGLRDPWSGLADVYVDGTFRARIDTYSAVNRYQDALYSIAGLAPGTHTLRIVVTGERSAASAGQWVWVDAFDVAGEAAPTPTPTSTPMPTATATPTVPPTDTPPPTATPTPTATAPPTSTPTPTPTTRPTPTPTSAPVTVTWINLVRASASGGTLTKTGTLEAYDAGAISSQSIASGDGSVEFTTPALGYRAAGLGVGDSSQHYSDIDFAIFTRADGSFNVMEKGTVLAAGGTYAGGDLFRIGIAAGVVRYYRNGALVHTSTQAVAYPLVVDTALYTPGVQVGSARLGTASSTPPPPTPTPTARPVVTPTPTPPPGGGRIEQNNTAVQYAGTWFSNPNPGHSGGSAALAMDAGSTATLAFQGTGVTWIGMRDPWSGQADVYIDGQLVTRVDTYAAGDQHQATLYSTSTLPAGAHTIRIVVTGQRNAASGGSWIWIDAFDVTGTSVPTATPTPRPIVTATPTPPPATPTPTSTPGGTMTPTVAPPTPTPTTPPPTPTPTPPPRATPTPTPGTTRYDQTHAAVTYAGAWFTQTKEVHSGGSAALAMDAGSEVSFPFNGTGVRWIGVRDQWAGEADVYVDGAHKGRIDTYSATELTRNVVYSATGLAAGPHTIRIVVPGTRNPASGGAWVWVDAFDVVGGTAGP